MLIIVLRVLSFVASYEAGYAIRWLMVHKAMYLAKAEEQLSLKDFNQKSKNCGSENHDRRIQRRMVPL